MFLIFQGKSYVAQQQSQATFRGFQRAVVQFLRKTHLTAALQDSKGSVDCCLVKEENLCRLGRQIVRLLQLGIRKLQVNLQTPRTPVIITSRCPVISKICQTRDLRNITSGKCLAARVIHQPNSKYHSKQLYHLL